MNWRENACGCPGNGGQVASQVPDRLKGTRGEVFPEFDVTSPGEVPLPWVGLVMNAGETTRK